MSISAIAGILTETPSGAVVDAFLALAAIAGAGLALFWIAMPETWGPKEEAITGKRLGKDGLGEAAE